VGTALVNRPAPRRNIVPLDEKSATVRSRLRGNKLDDEFDNKAAQYARPAFVSYGVATVDIIVAAVLSYA